MNEAEKKEMGKRIRERRLISGLSQEELAEILKMKRTNVANYEGGRVIPPGSVLLSMSQTFGVTTDYLLGRTDDPFTSLDENIAELQRARKRLHTDQDRKRMDSMIEMIKLSFIDAFNEDDDGDDDDDDL